MKFIVITRSYLQINKDGNIEFGNFADEEAFLIKNNDNYKFVGSTWDDKADELIERNSYHSGVMILEPVFRPFEVVIVDDDFIEIPYPHRKVYKWRVDYEVYDNLEEAINRSRELGEKFWDDKLNFFVINDEKRN